MKPTTGVAAIAIIGACASLVYFWPKADACATVTLTGWITPETFFSNRGCLESSTAAGKRVLARNSNGGNWESALALGVLIHRHGWDVEVEGFCASSCANFIFPAGKVKYLNSDSLLIFHGGPHQANLRAQYEAYEKALAAGGAPAQVQVSAREGKEGRAAWDPDGAAARRRIREFLAIKDAPTELGLMQQLIEESDRFYSELGVNIVMPTYGQVGRYESNYRSDKYGGFVYRVDSLRRLGIDNIEVKGGEWRPERHPDYPYLYEVTYP